jgi:hypothetical protein
MPTETSEFQGFAFIDWASKKHQLCLFDAAGQIRGERTFEHSGAGLAELCQWLLDQSGATADRIAVGLEVTDGPLVETLLEQGFAVFHLNPKQLDRFRDRYSPAGAKDDPPRRPRRRTRPAHRPRRLPSAHAARSPHHPVARRQSSVPRLTGRTA